ncbi:HlyD family secretion protein [Cytobacillus firmus]|uniref:HlyD family secretion protein n=2 Tax=Cytobacillus TaxID=2675230 RepID=A0A366JZH3_CYTFI|nr:MULTISPECIES: efflux RND transporter periplasmic adaptor subunit [Cytobacillus]RBP94397.1 HlyD family secretion protein [Cytobacillus firmus]TDX43144.1 HlyD family secretion protein [Cytobacillus oceanisediminis]
MNWKIGALSIATTVFLAVNMVLVLKSEKVGRTYYVDKWTDVKEQDIIETLPAKGVYVPKEEQHVYYDSKNGTFEGFLVNKGDDVEPGTGLFAYSPEDITLTKEKFEIEVEKLEKEQSDMESHINELEYMQAGLMRNSLTDDTSIMSNEYMIQTIEQNIKEKELEVSRIENEIEKYEDLVNAAEESLLNLTVTSEISGTIKDIQHDLGNPIVTVISDEQRVEGTLTEDEVKQIIEGMKVFITREGTNEKVNGTIEKILTYPTSKPDVDKKSKYAFSILLDEPSENQILHGEHAQVKVVLNEIIDTRTVPFDSIKKYNNKFYAFTITNTGRLEKRELQLGVKIDQTQEIKDGLIKGEKVVQERPPFLKAGTPLITPLNPAKIDKKGLKKLGAKEKWKYTARGFLSR